MTDAPRLERPDGFSLALNYVPLLHLAAGIALAVALFSRPPRGWPAWQFGSTCCRPWFRALPSQPSGVPPAAPRWTRAIIESGGS